MGNSPAWRCCIPHRPLLKGEDEQRDGTDAINQVELAASELFTVPGFATAYHTSVIVNGEEFFFSDSGIFNDRALTSHQGKPSERIALGMSVYTGAQMLRALGPHFRPGTYDLIKKNCNSFSDCAVYFLLRRRLQSRFSALERTGARLGTDMLQRFTKGMYVPNPAAQSYRTEEVIRALDQLGEGDIDEQPASSSTASGAGARSKPALAIGARVTVLGLKNAEHLNGQGAEIVRYNAVNGRWEARVNISGEVKAFRAENLRPAGEMVFEPGDRAKIHGLKSEASQNGYG